MFQRDIFKGNNQLAAQGFLSRYMQVEAQDQQDALIAQLINGNNQNLIVSVAKLMMERTYEFKEQMKSITSEVASLFHYSIRESEEDINKFIKAKLQDNQYAPTMEEYEIKQTGSASEIFQKFCKYADKAFYIYKNTCKISRIHDKMAENAYENSLKQSSPCRIL